MNWLVTKFISAFLLPPLNLLLLLIVAMTLLKSRPKLARRLLWLGITLLWLAATPWVSNTLLRSLEQDAVFDAGTSHAQAIVLLGAGRYFDAPEYGGSTIADYALERTRYTAYLAKKTGLPVLSSGGNPDGPGLSEGDLMKAVLEQEFKVPVRWVDATSVDTVDEAAACKKILATEGITNIVLVTHAWHMPRSRRIFTQAGFQVVPAPMGFSISAPFNILHVLPNSKALHKTSLAMHEWIGLVWYELRHGMW